MSSLQSINGFNLDSDLVQKFLKDYTILAKMAKTLFFVGYQVMWESLVMKKQMQLQSRTICYSDEASCHRHVSSYNEADIQPVAENMELLRWK